jgi:alpha,alpha-trehalase
MAISAAIAAMTAAAASVVAALAAGAAGVSAELPATSLGQPASGRAATAADLTRLHDYIRRGWTALTRSHRDLPAAAADPKLPPPPDGRWPVYVARRESLPAIEAGLATELAPADRGRIALAYLPADPARITRHGLLYLPRPYVVPGGRFNEMYGWDSYFILRGLLREGEGELGKARDLVENFLYEVESYGKVLNANRTYYLERSQPPFLGAMVRAVYARTRDRRWLERALPAIRTQYRYWVTPPHLAGDTGLSRYHALGSGPAPEVVAGELDAAGRTHYDRVREALRSDPPADLAVDRFYDRRRDRLTPLFYVADRSMRESGFDPSDRFGRFAAAILDHAPVCLNALLYAMETDAAAIAEELGLRREARLWTERAARRARAVRRFLWDEAKGLYLDYDFSRGRRRDYPFATTFFPLWVGLATPAEAERLAAAALPLLGRPGGLVTSTNRSGNQWDAPFGWAPLQLAAVEGLRRYGMDRQADDVALAFLGTVLKEHIEHGAVFEKYDVERRESDVSAGLRFGYGSNEIGFGWTNGVFLELDAGLTPARRSELLGFAAPNPPPPRPGHPAGTPYLPARDPDGRSAHGAGSDVEMGAVEGSGRARAGAGAAPAAASGAGGRAGLREGSGGARAGGAR